LSKSKPPDLVDTSLPILQRLWMWTSWCFPAHHVDYLWHQSASVFANALPLLLLYIGKVNQLRGPIRHIPDSILTYIMNYITFQMQIFEMGIVVQVYHYQN